MECATSRQPSGSLSIGQHRSWASTFIAGDADPDNFHAIARGRTSVPEHLDGRFGGTVLLEARWRGEGAGSRIIAVAGAGHEEGKMLPHVKAFLDRLLRG
jgi:hypothetical protein